MQALCSVQAFGSEQVSSAHPLGRCTGTRAEILPLPLMHTALHLTKKMWKQHLCPRIFALFLLPHSPLQAVGLCHIGVVSTGGTAETHLVLRVSGL